MNLGKGPNKNGTSSQGVTKLKANQISISKPSSGSKAEIVLMDYIAKFMKKG